jgi:hypothetical protein
MWWGFLSETAGEPAHYVGDASEGSAITSAGHHGLTRYRVSQSGADPLQQLAFGLAGIIIAFIVIGLYFGGVRF